MNKVENLDEGIYTFCYNQPRYEREIISHIYQVEKPTSTSQTTKISSKVKLLIQNQWLIETDLPKYNPTDKIIDQRMKKRKYVLSTAGPLLERLQLKGIQLTAQDRKQLKDILEDKSVRQLIAEDTKIRSIEGMLRRMSMLALQSYITLNYMRRQFPEIGQMTKREMRKKLKKKKKYINNLIENVEQKSMYIAPKLIKFEKLDFDMKQLNEIAYGAFEFISLGESPILKLAKITPDYDIISTLVIFAYSTAETHWKHR